MANPLKIFFAAGLALPMAALAADAVTPLSAGRWEQVLKGTSASVAGKALPEAIATSGNKTKFSCISPEEALDPARFFKRSGAAGADCSEPVGTVADGRVSLKATCQPKNGKPSLTAALAGTYSADNYHLDGEATMPTPQGNLVMKMTIDARHVGACKGDEQQ